MDDMLLWWFACICLLLICLVCWVCVVCLACCLLWITRVFCWVLLEVLCFDFYLFVWIMVVGVILCLLFVC